MWLLRSSDDKIKYLIPNETVNVGRKQAEIVLGNDSSISRAHATILVTLKDQIKSCETSSTCIIKDANSKYGTFISRNGAQIMVPKEGVELQPLDTVKFGLQQHIFRVEYVHFVTVISRLSVEHRKKLINIIDIIGGIVIDCYDDHCTHLTATTATSTKKIIFGLIAGIPIVDINYWISVLRAIKTDDDLPDPFNFTLPLIDKGVNTQRVSLKRNLMRRTLFQGKTFIFFDEKMCREYEKMITNTGGKVELLTSGSENIPEYFFTDDAVIMQLNNDDISQDLVVFNSLIYGKMQKKKLRMISETEIPLAIVYASLEQYCNPKYQFKKLMERKSLEKDVSEILAQDTEDFSISTAVDPDFELDTKRILIPETNNFTQSDVTGNNFPTGENPNTEMNYSKNVQPEELAEIVSKVKSGRVHVSPSVSKPAHINLNEGDDRMSLSSQSVITKTYIPDVKREQESVISPSPKTEIRNFKSKIIDTIVKKHTSNDKMTIIDHFAYQSNRDFLIPKMLSYRDKHSNFGEKQNEESASVEMEKYEVNKEKINCIEVQKKRKNVFDTDFHGLEQLRKQKKKNKQMEANEWGFKKSQNDIVDFDLDSIDIDINRPKEIFGKNISFLRIMNNKNSTRFSEEKLTVGSLRSAHDRLEDDVQLKTNIEKYTERFEDKLKNWSRGEFSETEYSMINRIKVRPIIRPNLDSAIGSQSSKAFKKIQNKIPNRIPSSNMTVWKPED